MATFTNGSVVLVSFPFSDLSHAKLRPAVVLAKVSHGDLILCQITSNPYSDSTAIKLTAAQFLNGFLERESFVRPGKLFTANEKIIVREIGILLEECRQTIVKHIIELLTSSTE